MQVTAKITPFQFYTMLFLGRVFTLVTSIINLKNDLSPTDFVLASIFMGIYLFITAIPTFLLLKSDSESSIITRASCVSAPFGKLLCVLYFFDFIFYGIMTAARFEILASSVMFPETNMLYAVVFLLGASSYAAYKGIEALGRSSVIFLVPVIFAFAFVFLSLLKRFDTLNFAPVHASDIIKEAGSGSYFTARTGELLGVAVMAPFVKGQKKHHVFVFVLLVTAATLITFLMIAGVLGNFGTLQLFSMYSMSVIAEFGFIERTDALMTCIWMICAGVKLSFILFICDYILSQFFEKSNKVLYLMIASLIIFAGMALCVSKIEIFAQIAALPIVPVIYLLMSAAVPLAVLAGEKIKGTSDLIR